MDGDVSFPPLLDAQLTTIQIEGECITNINDGCDQLSRCRSLWTVDTKCVSLFRVDQLVHEFV